MKPKRMRTIPPKMLAFFTIFNLILFPIIKPNVERVKVTNIKIVIAVIILTFSTANVIPMIAASMLVAREMEKILETGNIFILFLKFPSRIL